MRKELEYIDFRLREWARWLKRNDVRLGYPPEASEARIGVGRRDKRSGTKPEPEFTDEQTVEKAVARMRANPEVSDLYPYIEQYYLVNGSRRQKMKALGVRNKEHYYALLDRGRYYIWGQIDDDYA